MTPVTAGSEANVILGVSFDDWELAEQANVALFVRPLDPFAMRIIKACGS